MKLEYSFKYDSWEDLLQLLRWGLGLSFIAPTILISNTAM